MTVLGQILSTAEMGGLGGTVPTELKLSTASKGGLLRCIDGATGDTARTTTGWIEDEKYGWYASQIATAWSAEFDTAVTRTGTRTLKLSSTDNTGRLYVFTGPSASKAKYGIRVKPSTSYTLNCWCKTNGVGANDAYIEFETYTAALGVVQDLFTNKLTGTNDWTLLTRTFTTGATEVIVWLYINLQAGQVADAWFDVNSMTLEEIVTDTTFTGKVAEKIRPVLQAVTSTDNIDQSLDTGGAYANTYALTNAVNEGATHIQTFTPTKKYPTQIGVWVVEAGTAVDWTLVVHSATNVVLASKTIDDTLLVEGAMNYFDVPNIWASGALHFHLYAEATTGTPTAKTNTSNDLEAASYIQRDAKKSEDFTVVCNGVKTNLKADKDGILDGSVIDLDNAKYKYVNPFNAYGNFNDIFSASAGGGSTIPDVISGWDWTNTAESISSVSGATAQNIVIKVNTILPIKHLKITPTIFNNNVAAGQVDISADNVNYSVLQAQLVASASAQTFLHETDLMNGLSVFYLKIYKSTENTVLRIDDLKIEADIDTSKVPTGLFYPLATNQFTETVKLPAVATRVYLQTVKYTNEYGVVVPCLEYTDGSAVMIGYTPLKLDNSQETSPCVSILSSTTNYQQTGTGSAVTGGYVLNTGEYMTFTATVAEIKVDYQVGGGTTAIAAITKNTLFLSSNAESVDSTQDPSHQMNAIIGVRQQGLVDRVGDLGNEMAEIKKSPSLTSGELIGSGTAYTLTTSLAVVVFGTSGNLEFLAPREGLYEVILDACEDASAVTASAAANYSLYKLYMDSIALTNTERLGISFPIIAAALVGVNKITVSFKWYVRVYRAGALISIYAKQNSATTGAWTISSSTTGQTRLSWKRIGD